MMIELDYKRCIRHPILKLVILLPRQFHWPSARYLAGNHLDEPVSHPADEHAHIVLFDAFGVGKDTFRNSRKFRLLA